MEKITKDDVIGDVVKKHSKLAPIFLKHGLMCIGCAFASQETIEQGSIGHGIDMDLLLKELNEHLEKENDDGNGANED